MTLKESPLMKPKDALTIGEVAASFGWSTRFVEALVRGEKIPGLLINGVHYFRREDIIDWLNQKIQTLDAVRLGELERRMESGLGLTEPLDSASLSIREHLLPEAIDLEAQLSGKRSIIERLLDLACGTGRVLDRAHLLASVIDREAILSTALPGGIAICHPRRPAPSAVSDPVIAFLRTSCPVPFGSETGLTHLFFLLVATDERSHLHGLARLSRVLSTETIRALSDPNLKEANAVIDLLARQ